MTPWDAATAVELTAPEEVEVVTRRRDGTLRRPRIIWDVAVGERVFIRSTNGPEADWYRWALAAGRGQLIARGTAHDVCFVPAENADLPAVDAAYRATYGRYAGIVDHLLQDEPRGATLEVLPA